MHPPVGADDRLRKWVVHRVDAGAGDAPDDAAVRGSTPAWYATPNSNTFAST